MEKTIVSIIKNLCEENNISIGELEKSLGFSQGLISRWDKNSPSIDKVLSVSDYFQVSTDFILGRIKEKQSTKIEDSFIEKLITDTKNYNLNWKEYSEQFIKQSLLQSVFSDFYYIIDDNIILGDIEYAYELEYNSTCIYLVCAEFDYQLSVFLLMQLDKTNTEIEDNFVPISDYSDLNKTKILEREVSLYLKTYKTKDKSRIIMKNFINNVTTDSPFEPVPYSHVINNGLTTMPGFVLDARMGKFLYDKIFELQQEIDNIKKDNP